MLVGWPTSQSTMAGTELEIQSHYVFEPLNLEVGLFRVSGA